MFDFLFDALASYNFLHAMRQMQFFLSEEFSTFLFFQIDYFGLTHNGSYNLAETEQHCELSEALIWVSLLVLSGD